MSPRKHDIICIRELKLQAFVGIYEWEQRFKQTISLDLELAVDFRSCLQTQKVTDTVNYDVVVNQVTEFITSQPFSLLEVLAEQVTDLLLKNFPIFSVRICVRKLGAVANVKEIEVILERAKD